MKKMLVVLTLAILAIGSTWADGSSVTVQNQESWRFWYVLDPPGFADEEPGSPWLAVKATGFFANAEGEFPFTLLEPGASVSFDGLSEGTHYLLGFFEDDSLEELPVRLIAMQADSSMQARHYDVYSLPELIMADRGEGLLARFDMVEEPAAEPVAEAPAAEEPVVEMVAAPAPDEPVAEAAAVEPAAEPVAAEEPAVEAVVEAAVEAPVAAEPAVEAAAEAAAEEPVAEVAAEAATVEPAAEPVAAEEPAVEAVVEAAVEAPVAAEPAVEVAAEAAAEEPVAEVAAEAAAVEPAAEPVAAEEPAVEAVVEAAVEVAEAPPGPEVLVTFSESYDPVYFTRESREGFTVLPISSSRYWRKPGTRLAALSGSLQDGTFTLVLQSTGGFAKNVSFFFYVFPVRTAGGSSTYTFEARPEAGGRAAVVLWQKGRTVPRLVGTASTDGDQFTWTANADELPAELVRELGPAATLDLTTAWLDETSGTWEEFYFTTFAVADLTR